LKKFIIAALVSAQVLTAPPAFAQEYGSAPSTRLGMFAGVTVRVPLGGSGERAEAPQAALGVAPMARSQRLDGSSRTVIGDGLQLSLTPNRPVEVDFAGTRLDQFRLTPGSETSGGQRSGVSTLGWIAIGIGATAVIVVGAAAICLQDSDCIPDE